MKNKPTLCIVTPALAAANNGNWQTASRWARMLGGDYRVCLVAQWGAAGEAAGSDAMIALHARRSAPSIAAFAAARPGRPLVVALTGTDLYRDIGVDALAQRSLQLAQRLIVLHEGAPQDVPAPHRAKTVVSFQSTRTRRTLPKPAGRVRALMVGHLREEKMPQTLFDAVRLLGGQPNVRVDHIGDEIDPALGQQAQALAAECPTYRWLGARSHRETLARIQRAHVLVHCSRIEGGAHVVMEAVCSGTPVLASHIAGNVGMLGGGYSGYFALGDAPALARLLQRALADPAMLAALRLQCAARAPLFEPARERATLRKLMQDLTHELLETAP